MDDYYISKKQLEKFEDLADDVISFSTNCTEKECLQFGRDLDTIVNKMHDVIDQVKKQPA